jgi:hypothetical protein
LLSRILHGSRGGEIEALLLRAICFFVLIGILVAGLWPFHAPKNQVRWLDRESGLSFSKYGSIVSLGQFKVSASPMNGPASLEIWLEPRRVHSSGTILAFYWPDTQTVPFTLRQSLGDLVIQLASQHQRRARKVYAEDVFVRGNPVLITINSDQAGTTVYADGTFVKEFSGFTFSSGDLTGRLVVGNSPVTTDNWYGQLRGLAVYNRQLTPDEVSRHFAEWTKHDAKAFSAREGAIALYLFNEQSGNIVHNQIDSATDLIIPERFFVLHEQFLERPWDEFHQDWHYWKDVSINIAGFIPLGFSFYAYFRSIRKIKRPVLATVVLGFGVSLTIEVLQSFLPTRDSGMTDLITNTSGTALGVLFLLVLEKIQS